MKHAVLIIGLGLCAGGCVNAPDAKFAGTQQSKEVSGDLITHLACEMAAGVKQLRGPLPNYKVLGNLSVKATTIGGVAPSLNFITTLHGINTRTTILGGELTSTAAKTVTQNFSVDLAQVKDEDCGSRDVIQGKFGVDALIKREIERPYPAGLAVNNSEGKGFAATIEFTLKAGFNGGPYWVRTHFKGPSDKGLFNTSRTDMSTLTLVFVQTPPESPGRAALFGVNPALAALIPSADEIAERRARELLNQMILQNLTLANP